MVVGLDSYVLMTFESGLLISYFKSFVDEVQCNKEKHSKSSGHNLSQINKVNVWREGEVILKLENDKDKNKNRKNGLDNHI